MFMAPYHNVEPFGEVALLDQVLGTLRVRHAILVQHKHVGPLACAFAALRGGAHPAPHTHLSVNTVEKTLPWRSKAINACVGMLHSFLKAWQGT